MHLSVCMGARTCVCVRTSMYVWISKICVYVFISSSYGIRMCLCMRVAIRWILMNFFICIVLGVQSHYTSLMIIQVR